MTKRSLIGIGLPLLAVLVLIWFQERRATRLEQQVINLKSQITAAEKVQQENSRLDQQLKSATDDAEKLRRELVHLRSEKIALQKEAAALKASLPTPTAAPRVHDPTSVPEPQPYHYTQEQSQYFTERLDFGKKVGFAIQTLAEENNGETPQDLIPIAKWLSTNNVPVAGDTGPLFGVGVKDFELIYKGNLKNLAYPERVILAREVNPVEVHDGRWTRMYVFADGSVQRLEAIAADSFTAREKEVWPGQP